MSGNVEIIAEIRKLHDKIEGIAQSQREFPQDQTISNLFQSLKTKIEELNNKTDAQTEYLEGKISALDEKMKPVFESFQENQSFWKKFKAIATFISIIAATIFAVKTIWAFFIVDILHIDNTVQK